MPACRSMQNEQGTMALPRQLNPSSKTLLENGTSTIHIRIVYKVMLRECRRKPEREKADICWQNCTRIHPRAAQLDEILHAIRHVTLLRPQGRLARRYAKAVAEMWLRKQRSNFMHRLQKKKLGVSHIAPSRKAKWSA